MSVEYLLNTKCGSREDAYSRLMHDCSIGTSILRGGVGVGGGKFSLSNWAKSSCQSLGGKYESGIWEHSDIFRFF